MNEIARTSLVIDSRKLQRMGMDGPALKVVMLGRSPVLFPLRRLHCIHIIGTPTSGMEALLFCAEQRVPVSFFTATGQLRCTLRAPTDLPTLPDHWLEHVEFDPQFRQLYADWRLNQGLYVLSQLGITRGIRNSRCQWVQDTLRSLCRRELGGERFRTAMDWLQGLLHQQLEQVIETFGFAQHRGKQKLLADLEPICQVLLLHALAVRLQRAPGFNVTAQGMTAFYQQHADELEFTSRRMLVQLVNGLEAII